MSRTTLAHSSTDPSRREDANSIDEFIRLIKGLGAVAAAAAAALAFPQAGHAQSAPARFIDEMQQLFNYVCDGNPSPDCSGAPPGAGGQVEAQNQNLSQLIIEQRLRELQCPPDAGATPLCGRKEEGASEDSTSLQGLSLFVSTDYENKNKDNTSFETGFNSDKAGITVGVDSRIGTDGVIGGAINYGHTWGDFDGNGGHFDENSWGALLYGSVYPSDQSFIDGVIGIALKDYQIDRQFTRLAAGGPPMTPAKGDTTGFEFTSSLSGGYDFTFDALTVGPRLGLHYKRTEYSDFSESGSVLSLHYDDQVEDSLTSTVGVQASYAISTSFGVVVPQVNADYVHEFLNDQRTVHAHSVAAPAVAVNFQTDPPDRNYFDIGAGVVFVLPDGVSPYLNYQAELANRFEETHTVTLGLRLEL